VILWNYSSTNILSVPTRRIHEAEKTLIEGVLLGAETRLLSSLSGFSLNQNVGNAFFARPTLAIAFQGRQVLNFILTPQPAGGARPASTPGALDIDNDERHELPVKFATPFMERRTGSPRRNWRHP
jgi:hypothetical protein